MTTSQLPARSRARLQGVHPDLVRVVERAFEITPFRVTEGLRSLAKQQENIARGVSWTPHSRHLTGHAVDLCEPDGGYDVPDMIRIGAAMKQAAKELEIPIVWGALKKHGGDWKTRNDMPHFELDSRAYPAKSPVPVRARVAHAAKVAASARAVGGAAAGTGVTAVATQPDGVSGIPGVPGAVSGTVSSLTNWQSIGDTLWTSINSIAAQPLPWLIGGLLLAVVWLWPRKGAAS